MTETAWFAMEVFERRQETPLLVSLKLVPESEELRLDFRAGQCVKILCPDGRESYFAIASEPEQTEGLEFLIKDQPASAAHTLCQVRAGEKVKMSLPFGKGYPVDRLNAKDVLLIGIGSGLSPLRSLLKSMLRRDQEFGQITLLYGARTPEDLPFPGEFGFWRRKIKVELAISQPRDSRWEGFVGRVTERLPQLRFNPLRTAVCLCGSKAMQEEVTNLLEKAGVSKENVFLNY